MADHHFVTVLNRRWCLTCDLFQSKRYGAAFQAAGSCSRIYTAVLTCQPVTSRNALRRCRDG